MRILSEQEAKEKGYSRKVLSDDSVVGVMNTITYKDFKENEIDHQIIRDSDSKKGFTLVRKNDFPIL